MDVIEFDLIVAKPALRISAGDLRRKLLRMSKSWDFFEKNKCCKGDVGISGYQNVSVKSLERMNEFLATMDSETMDVDIGEIMGALDVGFFGAL